MRVRFSTCIGMYVVCDSVDEVLGQLKQILLHPDTGKVEGFFVTQAPMDEGTPFLAADDIVRWGTQVHVRDPDAVYPIEERIRLAHLLSDPRTVLGQQIRTEGGRNLGVCRDVQFNTDSMRSEWLFPRRFWRWGIPVAMSDVIEVTPQAVIVRDLPVPAPVEETIPAAQPAELLPQLPDIGSAVRKAN
jgi:sporulation protein YlmC with PRC-barrel domain